MKQEYELFMDDNVVGEAIFSWEGLRSHRFTVTLLYQGKQVVTEVNRNKYLVRFPGLEIKREYLRDQVGVFHLTGRGDLQTVGPLNMFEQTSKGVEVRGENITFLIKSLNLPVAMIWALSLAVRSSESVGLLG